MGQRVTFTFHCIIYAPASSHTAAKGAFCFAAAAAESNSAPFAALHLNGVYRWTSQLPLRGSFSKRSTGQRVNGFFFEKVNRSMGQTGRRVTFTFAILYMIADDARLTPPRCKKHTAYDDTRLTPHHCKKHTASFARSTGKFPSISKCYEAPVPWANDIGAIGTLKFLVQDYTYPDHEFFNLLTVIGQ